MLGPNRAQVGACWIEAKSIQMDPALKPCNGHGTRVAFNLGFWQPLRVTVGLWKDNMGNMAQHEASSMPKNGEHASENACFEDFGLDWLKLTPNRGQVPGWTKSSWSQVRLNCLAGQSI